MKPNSPNHPDHPCYEHRRTCDRCDICLGGECCEFDHPRVSGGIQVMQPEGLIPAEIASEPLPEHW